MELPGSMRRVAESHRRNGESSTAALLDKGAVRIEELEHFRDWVADIMWVSRDYLKRPEAFSLGYRRHLIQRLSERLAVAVDLGAIPPAENGPSPGAHDASTLGDSGTRDESLNP